MVEDSNATVGSLSCVQVRNGPSRQTVVLSCVPYFRLSCPLLKPAPHGMSALIPTPGDWKRKLFTELVAGSAAGIKECRRHQQRHPTGHQRPSPWWQWQHQQYLHLQRRAGWRGANTHGCSGRVRRISDNRGRGHKPSPGRGRCCEQRCLVLPPLCWRRCCRRCRRCGARAGADARQQAHRASEADHGGAQRALAHGERMGKGGTLLIP